MLNKYTDSITNETFPIQIKFNSDQFINQFLLEDLINNSTDLKILLLFVFASFNSLIQVPTFFADKPTAFGNIVTNDKTTIINAATQAELIFNYTVNKKR